MSDSKFGSRKFVIAILMLAIGVGTTFMGLLTPQLVELVKWTGGLYFGFNVSQRAAEFFAPKKES